MIFLTVCYLDPSSYLRSDKFLQMFLILATLARSLQREEADWTGVREAHPKRFCHVFGQIGLSRPCSLLITGVRVAWRSALCSAILSESINIVIRRQQ